MAEIKKAAEGSTEPVRTQKLWPIGGRGWNQSDKKERKMINVLVGNQKEPFEQIVLRPGDRLVLRENTNKREGKKDPDWTLCLPE